MKKLSFVLLLALVLLVGSSTAKAEKTMHFNMGLIPAGFMIVPDADGFKASNTGVFTFASEELDGSALYTPGAFAGLDFDAGSSSLGFDVYGNAIVSDALTGNMFGINGSYVFPHEEDSIFKIRAKGGIFQSSLDWEGDFTTVEFDDATGWQAGLGFEVGKSVSFYGELLYKSLEHDVDTSKSDPTTENSLDLSGGTVNLGVKFTF